MYSTQEEEEEEKQQTNKQKTKQNKNKKNPRRLEPAIVYYIITSLNNTALFSNAENGCIVG